jgi:hypothetical protein
LAPSRFAGEFTILNAEHPLVKWVSSLARSLDNPDMSFQMIEPADELHSRVLRLIARNEWRALREGLADWRMSVDFPKALRPPEVEINDKSIW